MYTAFRTALPYLLALAGLVFAGCERPEEKAPEPAPARRVKADDEYETVAHVCSTAEEDQALARINLARGQTGLTLFACLEKLSAMATAHAEFLAANEGIGLASAHREVAGAPGYTGDTLGERAEAQGLDAANFWLAEGAGGGAAPTEVVDAHLATVYHRSALLAPGGRYFSFAMRKGRAPHAVMNMLLWVAAEESAAARWPASDATKVPVAFNGTGEKPEPRANAELAGYPVSVHFPRFLLVDRSEPELSVEEFELRDASGALVDADLLTRANDSDVYPTDAFLLPRRSLEPAKKYSVKARMSYGDLAVDTAWTFSTAP